MPREKKLRFPFFDLSGQFAEIRAQHLGSYQGGWMWRSLCAVPLKLLRELI